jgi:predicted O-methyltransferase YrrM
MIEEQHINFDFIVRYVREFSLGDENVKKLYNFAAEKGIPAAKPETMALLNILTLLKRPRRVLEIGTGIGCSAVIMSKGLLKNGKIITVEKDENNYNEAVKLFAENGLTGIIDAVNADGIDVLKELSEKNEKFDLIFLDGAKAQYLSYYPHLINSLDKDGILISDNVLYKGMAANDELIEKRKRTIVARLRKYLKLLYENKELRTVVIPIGDGVAISIHNA